MTDQLDALLAHNDQCPDQSNPYRPDCIHDNLDYALRSLLIINDDDPLPTDDMGLLDMMAEPSFRLIPSLRLLVTELTRIRDNEYMRGEISMLRYNHSLCPLHGIDYAICFDDMDPECAVIRHCFPSHDT